MNPVPFKDRKVTDKVKSLSTSRPKPTGHMVQMNVSLHKDTEVSFNLETACITQSYQLEVIKYPIHHMQRLIQWFHFICVYGL